MNEKRHLVIVDCETSGLRAGDVAVEVAWHNIDTGERGCFVPPHDVEWVRRHGEPKALEINGYRSRLSNAWQDNGTGAIKLYRSLRGQTLGGSNPAFDARHLTAVFGGVAVSTFEDAGIAIDAALTQPWHHRLADLAGYAAGALGIDPREMQGLAGICEQLDVDPPDHTAAGDVRATVECFRRLAELRSVGG